MRRSLSIAAVLCVLFTARAMADAYTVAFDSVQATAYRNLSNGFLGAGVSVAQVELQRPETNHVAFSNIIFNLHQNDSGGAHPTGVGSILYGRAPGFNGGVATGVTNVEYWNANNFINDVVVPNVAISSKVVSQSYTAGTNSYAYWNAAFDYWVQQQKVVLVSGGIGTATNWDFPSSSYNGIAVGASDAYGNPSGSPVGPTQNGRSKPDLIAPRSTQVAASPSITGNNTTFTNSSYTSIEGVSLSAPFVAGAATILMDKAMDTAALSNATDPRVIKSLLMTSALKKNGWHKGTNGLADDASVPLDYTQGAGLLQVKSAYDLLSAGEQAYGTGNVLSNGWDFASVGGTLQNRTRTYNLFLSNSVFLNTNFSITATLNWYENVAANYSTSLQNLDLKLKYNGSYLQYSTSIVDNVEHLWFTTNAPGIYTLEVTAANTATPYALSWTAVAVPEPSTVILLGAVLGAALLTQRARRER